MDKPLKIGKGKKKFFVFADLTHMGNYIIGIKITEQQSWAIVNRIIVEIHADSLEEAQRMFKILDTTR